jgi:hypothetical protein
MLPCKEFVIYIGGEKVVMTSLFLVFWLRMSMGKSGNCSDVLFGIGNSFQIMIQGLTLGRLGIILHR